MTLNCDIPKRHSVDQGKRLHLSYSISRRVLFIASVPIPRACFILNNICCEEGDHGEWLDIDEPLGGAGGGAAAAAAAANVEGAEPVAPGGERVAGLRRRQAIVRLFA